MRRAKTQLRRATKAAVRRVLTRAPDTPQFFDRSDAERLVTMIAMGFELGVAEGRRGSPVAGRLPNGGGSSERTGKRSRRG